MTNTSLLKDQRYLSMAGPNMMTIVLMDWCAIVHKRDVAATLTLALENGVVSTAHLYS